MSATQPSPEPQPVADLDPHAQDLARQLRDTRREKGLSRAAVARSAGLTRRELRAYESGKVPIPESDLWCLAGSCGVPVDALIPTRTGTPGSDLAALANGDLLRRLAAPAEPEAVLREYLAVVYELRNLAPGSRVPLGDEELRRLAGALGGTPEAIEHRLVEMAGVTPPEAARLRAMILPPLAISGAGATPEPAFAAVADPFATQPAPYPEPDPFLQPDPLTARADPFAALEAEAATYQPVFANAHLAAGEEQADDHFAAWAADGARQQVSDDEPSSVGVSARSTVRTSASGADPVDGITTTAPTPGSWGLDPEVRDRTMALIDELLADPDIGIAEPADAPAPVAPDPFGYDHAPYAPDEPVGPVDDGLGTGVWDPPTTPMGDHDPADLPLVDVGEPETAYPVDVPVADLPVVDMPTGALPLVDLPVESDEGAAWPAEEPWQPEPWAPDPWAANAPVTEPIDVLDVPPAGDADAAAWYAHAEAPPGTWWNQDDDEPAPPMLLDDLPIDAMLDGFMVDTAFADGAPQSEPGTGQPVTGQPVTGQHADAEPTNGDLGPISWSNPHDAAALDDTTPVAGTDVGAPAEPEADDEPAPEPASWRDAGPNWQLGGTFPNAAIAADGMLALRRAETRWALADIDGTTEFVVDADVDLVSGAGFGVLFAADVDLQGRLAAYSFDVDPVRDGGTFLVRQWDENREHWRPLAEEPIGPGVLVTGRHHLAVELRGDSMAARFDGRRVLAISGLSRASVASGQEPCHGKRVGVHAWTTTEINVLALRVGDVGEASDDAA